MQHSLRLEFYEGNFDVTAHNFQADIEALFTNGDSARNRPFVGTVLNLKFR